MLKAPKGWKNKYINLDIAIEQGLLDDLGGIGAEEFENLQIFGVVEGNLVNKERLEEYKVVQAMSKLSRSF